MSDVPKEHTAASADESKSEVAEKSQEDATKESEPTQETPTPTEENKAKENPADSTADQAPTEPKSEPGKPDAKVEKPAEPSAEESKPDVASSSKDAPPVDTEKKEESDEPAEKMSSLQTKTSAPVASKPILIASTLPGVKPVTASEVEVSKQGDTTNVSASVPLATEKESSLEKKTLAEATDTDKAVDKEDKEAAEISSDKPAVESTPEAAPQKPDAASTKSAAVPTKSTAAPTKSAAAPTKSTAAPTKAAAGTEKTEADDDNDDGDEVESDVSGSDDENEEEEEEEDDEPPQKTVRSAPRTPARKVMQVRTPGANEKAPPTTGKKRGRPSKADMEKREKERQEAIARGEPDPDLKRKRRKPNKLKDAASEEEEEENKGRRKRKLKETETPVEESDGDKPKKKGRKKILTPEEIEQREKERKRKYAELRAIQKAKKEKREKYLIMKREEKKKQKQEEKRKKEEHEKRMAELRAQYLDDNATDGSGGPGTPAEFYFDENSQSSLGSQSMSVKKRKAWGDVGMLEMMGTHNPLAHVTAETLFEYKWPLEGRNSEHYFLQEQVTEYLHVKSFKRKYPDCPRRTVDMEERDFLMEMKIVNETQADLGLTAIPSSAVLDIMCQDFYDKYESYMAVLNERKERNLRNLNYSSGGGDVKVEEAAKIAAEFNKQLNQERREQRTAYFDMQTFRVHYPKNNKGKMKVLQKPKLGNYPIALIPGQFVDSFKSYSSKELQYFPINTVMVPPPKPGVTLKDLNLGSDGSESDTDSSSSGSSEDSDSESEAEAEEEKSKADNKEQTEVKAEVKGEVKNETKEVKEEEPPAPPKPKFAIDEIRPNAVCKTCQGNMNQNKIGVSEMLLHCSKCTQSCHPTCVGLHLDLLQYVTNYQWECTDCKKCMKCQDPADEDKMLFCDLCDRGYHIYCVGLQEVPVGRWHCYNCAVCISCGTTSPCEDSKTDLKNQGWVHETKLNLKGEKIFSHTMCQSCHKTWKKGLFCPECNGTFDRNNKPTSNCWVCSRQHHISCVGLDRPGERFICSGCQRKVQDRTVGARNGIGKAMDTPSRKDSFSTPYNKTPVTSSFSRSGRRVTQINFANQF